MLEVSKRGIIQEIERLYGYFSNGGLTLDELSSLTLTEDSSFEFDKIGELDFYTQSKDRFITHLIIVNGDVPIGYVAFENQVDLNDAKEFYAHFSIENTYIYLQYRIVLNTQYAEHSNNYVDDNNSNNGNIQHPDLFVSDENTSDLFKSVKISDLRTGKSELDNNRQFLMIDKESSNTKLNYKSSGDNSYRGFVDDFDKSITGLSFDFDLVKIMSDYYNFVNNSIYYSTEYKTSIQSLKSSNNIKLIINKYTYLGYSIIEGPFIYSIIPVVSESTDKMTYLVLLSGSNNTRKTYAYELMNFSMEVSELTKMMRPMLIQYYSSFYISHSSKLSFIEILESGFNVNKSYKLAHPSTGKELLVHRTKIYEDYITVENKKLIIPESADLMYAGFLVDNYPYNCPNANCKSTNLEKLTILSGYKGTNYKYFILGYDNLTDINEYAPLTWTTKYRCKDCQPGDPIDYLNSGELYTKDDFSNELKIELNGPNIDQYDSDYPDEDKIKLISFTGQVLNQSQLSNLYKFIPYDLYRDSWIGTTRSRNSEYYNNLILNYYMYYIHLFRLAGLSRYDIDDLYLFDNFVLRSGINNTRKSRSASYVNDVSYIYPLGFQRIVNSTRIIGDSISTIQSNGERLLMTYSNGNKLMKSLDNISIDLDNEATRLKSKYLSYRGLVLRISFTESNNNVTATTVEVI